jgi:apolipoprotein N-acyltransferase
VSNDGVTALVDPAGRIAWKVPTQRATTQVAAVSWLSGSTGYHLLGDWPVYLCALLVLGMSVWAPPRAPGGVRTRAAWRLRTSVRSKNLVNPTG